MRRPTTARGRAGKAVRIYKTRRADGYSRTDFGRSLDFAFENGDGYAVALWMLRTLLDDSAFVDAVFRHHPGDEGWWLKRAARAVRNRDHLAFYAVWQHEENEAALVSRLDDGTRIVRPDCPLLALKWKGAAQAPEAEPAGLFA